MPIGMQWCPFLARSFKRETAAFACSVAVASVVSHDFPVEASTEDDFDKTFANLVELKVDALVVQPDVFFTSRDEQFGTLAQRYAVPTISMYRPFVAAGGLVSYGPRETDNYRFVGYYAGKVLKGEKPADLPVLRSTKVELLINLKAAKAFGVTVPLDLIGRAGELIE
jgi:putative ABC transport system substrate-binding protein